MLKRYRNLLIVIVIVVGVSVWLVLPNNPGIHVLGIDREIETRLGLDLVGGVQALLEADLPADQEIPGEAMTTATRIVENRVNGLGVTEAIVQQAGERRIVVELPGETDPEKALQTVQQTGLLEFVDFSSLSDQEAFSLVGTRVQTDFAQEEGEAEASGVISPTQASQVFHTIMTGTTLENVNVTTTQTGEPQVAFSLNQDGAQIFRDFTTNHVGQILAIVLDKEVISTPGIREPITDGQGVISGNFTIESANALAIQLRYGSLPIPLKVVETRTVGPTLGQDSLQKSLIAGAVGFAVVVLFMGLYYRLPGIIAIIAVALYAIFAYAIFRYIPVTLTLPGIAGFLLSTGSALDANILMFERFKEELRSGRNMRQALDLGWQRAWPSIRDSNIATLITSGILFWFGSAFGATIVKGFSLTLAIGVAVSLFTAIVVTRTLLNLILEYIQPENKVRWFGI
jgi:preprotein translocase subunit SecD